MNADVSGLPWKMRDDLPKLRLQVSALNCVDCVSACGYVGIIGLPPVTFYQGISGVADSWFVVIFCWRPHLLARDSSLTVGR